MRWRHARKKRRRSYLLQSELVPRGALQGASSQQPVWLNNPLIRVILHVAACCCSWSWLVLGGAAAALKPV